MKFFYEREEKEQIYFAKLLKEIENLNTLDRG